MRVAIQVGNAPLIPVIFADRKLAVDVGVAFVAVRDLRPCLDEVVKVRAVRVGVRVCGEDLPRAYRESVGSRQIAGDHGRLGESGEVVGRSSHVWIADLLAHRVQLLASLHVEARRVAKRRCVPCDLLGNLLPVLLAHPPKLAHVETSVLGLGDEEACHPVGKLALVRVEEKVREARVRGEAEVVVVGHVARPLLPVDIVHPRLRDRRARKG